MWMIWLAINQWVPIIFWITIYKHSISTLIFCQFDIHFSEDFFSNRMNNVTTEFSRNYSLFFFFQMQLFLFFNCRTLRIYARNHGNPYGSGNSSPILRRAVEMQDNMTTALHHILRREGLYIDIKFRKWNNITIGECSEMKFDWRMGRHVTVVISRLLFYWT